MAVGERLMVAPHLRGSPVASQLRDLALEDVEAAGVRLIFGNCEPHLLSLYLSSGGRTYAEHNINSEEAGYLIPLVWPVGETDDLAAAIGGLDGQDRPCLPRSIAAALARGDAVQSASVVAPAEYLAHLEAALERVALEGLHAFDGLDPEETRECIARSNIIECDAGDRVLKQGGSSHNLFLVLDGTLEVRHDGRFINVLGPGDVFGEMAFLLDLPRQSDVYAATGGREDPVALRRNAEQADGRRADDRLEAAAQHLADAVRTADQGQRRRRHLNGRCRSGGDDVEVRAIAPADAQGVSDCIVRCYGDAYPKRVMYRPDELATLIGSRAYNGVVATAGPGVVGHIGFTWPTSESTVVEAGTTVVDPSCRGMGLMGRLALALVELLATEGAAGFIHFPTTAHPVMQRASLSAGGRETGVMVAYLPAATRDLAMGALTEERVAVTVVYQPVLNAPAQSIHLPRRYSAMILGFADGLGLSRSAAPDVAAADRREPDRTRPRPFPRARADLGRSHRSGHRHAGRRGGGQQRGVAGACGPPDERPRDRRRRRASPPVVLRVRRMVAGLGGP